MLIPPTPGRIVWFYPHASDRSRLGMLDSNPEVPLAAIVTKVWGERMVNLCVFDPHGHSLAFTSVPLVQPDSTRPDLGSQGFCEWMPYQLGQAAKA